MPYAVRVASMFFLMYGASLACSFGSTWNFCTIAGYRPPMRTADSTSRPKPITGSCHVRRQMVEKNSTAQITAMQNRIVFAGRYALASTYRRPVQLPAALKSLDFTASPYRSSQYATAFSETKIPISTERWPVAAPVARVPGLVTRSPPYR